MDEDLPRLVPRPSQEEASEDTEAVVTEAPPTTKQVFVAYSYKAYPKADYRKVFAELEKTYDVKFVFADEKITNMHIMAKIISYIRSSDFSLFDITGWNPNVTLELGWAMASVPDGWYICFDPSKFDVKDVPSDLRGIDRMEYDSYTALQTKLSVLLAQRYPKRSTAGVDSFLDEKRKQAIESLGKQPGLTMKSLAQLLGVETQVAQFLMQPLVGKTVETTGKTRGMKYYLKGQAPKKG